MQVLQAGKHKLLLLELDPEFVGIIARQAGFELKVSDNERSLMLDLSAPEDRESPLLLFDAADPGNLGWFSRCQFYVDGHSGAVLQTPISLANRRDAKGKAVPNGLFLQIAKEIPASFNQTVTDYVNVSVVNKNGKATDSATNTVAIPEFYHYLLALAGMTVIVTFFYYRRRKVDIVAKSDDTP